MIRYFKKSFAQKIARIFPGLLYARGIEVLQKLRALPNAFIDMDVTLGECSSFYMEGQFKKLSLGKGVFFRKVCNVLVYPDASLSIGENVFFNNYCSINCLGQIEIGTKTVFGEAVKLYDHNHEYHFGKDGSLFLDKDDYTWDQ